MSFNLQHDDVYDLTKIIKMAPSTPYYKYLMWLMLPYTIPKVMINAARARSDKNPLHDGVRILTGEKRVALGKKLLLEDVK